MIQQFLSKEVSGGSWPVSDITDGASYKAGLALIADDVTWGVDNIQCWVQDCCRVDHSYWSIKTKSRHQKPPRMGISCLWLCPFGKRISKFSRISDLEWTTLVVVSPVLHWNIGVSRGGRRQTGHSNRLRTVSSSSSIPLLYSLLVILPSRHHVCQYHKLKSATETHTSFLSPKKSWHV